MFLTLNCPGLIEWINVLARRSEIRKDKKNLLASVRIAKKTSQSFIMDFVAISNPTTEFTKTVLYLLCSDVLLI